MTYNKSACNNHSHTLSPKKYEKTIKTYFPYPNEVKRVLLSGAEGPPQQVCPGARGAGAAAMGPCPAQKLGQARAACRAELRLPTCTSKYAPATSL